jgi:protein phosphatase
MATSPQKNVITRAVTPGEENRHRPDIIHITNVLPGDYFYMCSDGMLEQMTNNELLALFSADAPDEKKRSELIKETVNNKDNHSAWLIHVKNVNLEEGDDKLVNEEPEARCNAINIIPYMVAEDDNHVVIIKENPKRLSFYKWIKKLFSIIKNKR